MKIKMSAFKLRPSQVFNSVLAKDYSSAKEPAQISVRVGKKGNRSYLANTDFIQKYTLKREARHCQRVLRRRIHKSICGFTKGRGINRALPKLVEWKELERPITKLDNKKAFRSVDKLRSDSRQKKMGLLPFSEAVGFVLPNRQ